jgi:predicted lysophospholipase L1 biosynthesis ABC-type transport system permease subunit
MLLSFAGAWGLQKWVFKGAFEPAFGSAIAIAAVLMGLTLLIGFLTGREAFKETPMAALREG